MSLVKKFEEFIVDISLDNEKPYTRIFDGHACPLIILEMLKEYVRADNTRLSQLPSHASHFT